MPAFRTPEPGLSTFCVIFSVTKGIRFEDGTDIHGGPKDFGTVLPRCIKAPMRMTRCTPHSCSQVTRFAFYSSTGLIGTLHSYEILRISITDSRGCRFTLIGVNAK